MSTKAEHMPTLEQGFAIPEAKPRKIAETRPPYPPSLWLAFLQSAQHGDSFLVEVRSLNTVKMYAKQLSLKLRWDHAGLLKSKRRWRDMERHYRVWVLRRDEP